MRQDARKLFAFNLKRLLSLPGKSGAALARHLGVPQQMVSRWLQGEILPTKHLENIAEYFVVEIAELFRSEGTPPPAPRAISDEEALDAIARRLGFTVRKMKEVK